MPLYFIIFWSFNLWFRVLIIIISGIKLKHTIFIPNLPQCRIITHYSITLVYLLTSSGLVTMGKVIMSPFYMVLSSENTWKRHSPKLSYKIIGLQITSSAISPHSVLCQIIQNNNSHFLSQFLFSSENVKGHFIIR